MIRERLRVKLRRNPQPSAGIVDSQPAETPGVGGEERGYDGGKNIEGRKKVPTPQALVARCGCRGEDKDKGWWRRL